MVSALNSYEWNTPIERKKVLELHAGDRVSMTGIIYSMRDQAIRRILREKTFEKAIPKLEDAAIYNCGPLARKKNGNWELISAGPTTSSRMNALMPELIREHHISAIIGKGGMSQEVLDAMKGKAVYLSAVGGSGAVSAQQLKVNDVQWMELGMPEALWTLEAKLFGPLIVSMDAHGNSLYENVQRNVEERLKTLQL